MNDVESIKAHYRIEQHLESIGVKLRGSGNRRTTNCCPMQEHAKGHDCVTVDINEQWFKCNDCDLGGDVIRWMALESGRSDGDVIKELSGKMNGGGNPEKAAKKKGYDPGPCVATYDYVDETGELLYQVRRHQPADGEKTFRPRRPDKNGGWIGNMDGVRRVLYNLLDVMFAEEVWVVEGEKDANNLKTLGFAATCSAGGAKNWKEAYAESLIDKDLVICGDNDEPGKEYVEAIRASVEGKVRSLRVVKVPPPHKDISDLLATFPEEDEARMAVTVLRDSVPLIPKGVDLNVFSMRELESKYRAFCQSLQSTTLNLSSWLPSLQNRVRSIVPGEVIMFIADTGVGKTALLSNLALHSAPLTTLFFEMELPESLLYERIVAAHMQWPCVDVEDRYVQAGQNLSVLLNQDFQPMDHIHVCPQSLMTIEMMERLIVRSQLKTDKKAQLVLIDYIQLIRGDGKSRYEKTSMVAEEIKAVAKRTNTIIVVASQISRKNDDGDNEVTLHEGKDSGSIENSAGLVIGAWRDLEDDTTLYLRILKNTKGRSGYKITCNFHGLSMRITERSPVADTAVPPPSQTSFVPPQAAEPEMPGFAYSQSPDP